MHLFNFSIAPTFNCQLRCKHCYTDKLRNVYKNEMSFKTAEKTCRFIEKSLKSFNAQLNLTFTGGEPLLVNKELMRIFFEFGKTMYSNENFVIFINTNLLAFDESWINLIAQYPFVKLCASFDLGKVRFDSEKLIEIWKKKFFLAQEKLGKKRVYLSVTLTSEFLKYDFYQILEKLNFPPVILSIFSPVGQGKKNLHLYLSKKTVSLILIALSLTCPPNVHIFFTKKDMVEEYERLLQYGYGSIECWGECWNTFLIAPNGDIYFAGLCFSDKKLGNITKTTLEELAVHPLRLAFLKTRMSNEKCISCSHFEFCRGGCASLKKIKDDLSDCSGLKIFLDYCFFDVLPFELEKFLEQTWFKKYVY